MTVRHDLCEDIARIARTRVHVGHRMRVLRNAKEIIPAVLARVGVARRCVWMEIYTIKKGRLEGLVIDELARAAQRGVSIRVLVDAVGSRTLPREFSDALSQRGITSSFYRSPLARSLW